MPLVPSPLAPCLSSAAPAAITSGAEGAASPLPLGAMSPGDVAEGGVVFTVADSAKLSACVLAYSDGSSSGWAKASHLKFKGSKGLLTIPGIAFLDGINLETGLIDPINMWESRTGGGKVATFKHASGTVQILLPPRAVDERAFVRVGNVEGWMHESFLTPEDNTPKSAASAGGSSGGGGGGGGGGGVKRCSKGKPCGNTCIAVNKTCHK